MPEMVNEPYAPKQNKENNEGVYSELLKKLEAIEESLKNLKTSNTGNGSPSVDSNQIATKADISALWSEEKGIGRVLTEVLAAKSQEMINKQAIDAVKENFGSVPKTVEDFKKITDKLCKNYNKKGSSEDNAAIKSLPDKIETIGKAITEINLKLDGIGNKKRSSVDDAAIKSLPDKIEKTVSSAVQKLNDDVAHKERKFLSKEMIMIMISVLILTVSTVFISYGVLLRYENGLAFDLSWWALIVYGVTFLATLLIIIFHNRLTKCVVASRIVRIFMALFLVATLALSALSLLSVFLL